MNSRQRLTLLERELEHNLNLQDIARSMAPGETMLVSYWPGMPFIECTYKEVRLALAQLTLKGLIK